MRLAMGTKKSRSHTNLAVVERLFMRALENGVQTREGGELRYAILSTVKKAVQNKGDIGEDYNQKKLSPVPEEVAEMVLKASDGAIDISNKTIAVNGDDIYHAHRRHSDEQKEISRNQIAISENDIAEMIEAIYAPDVVECLFDDTNNPTQKQSFAYAKKKDGYYIVAEAVGGKRNPNIVPAMMIYVTEAKWNQFVGAGKTIGEMIYENDFDKLSALDVQKNKKNRVIAAQFVLNKTIANTPRSPRSNTNVPQNVPGVKNYSMQETLENSSNEQKAIINKAWMQGDASVDREGNTLDAGEQGPKKRQFHEKRKMGTDANHNDALVEKVREHDETYTPISNQETLEKAKEKLRNPEYSSKLKRRILKFNSKDMFTSVDVAAAEVMINDAINDGDLDLAHSLIVGASRKGTELGRAVQAFAMQARLTPCHLPLKGKAMTVRSMRTASWMRMRSIGW